MPGDIQAEFYFHTFKATDGSAWLKACQQYATGDKWPSVDALKASIRSQPTTMLQLPDPVKAVLSMGEALKDRPDLQQTIRRVMGPERESV